MSATIRIHLFRNVPAGAYSGAATVSIGRLMGEDGHELPCPFDEEREFRNIDEVKAELAGYFGRDYVFVEA